MNSDDGLFEMSPDMSVRIETIGGRIPVIVADKVYRRPDEIREAALGLAYAPPPYPYPGRLALIPEPNPSLSLVRQRVLEIVNGDYLPRVPIAQDGRRISSFGQLYTDFAIVDVHPDELTEVQRLPHTDPVPVFGLVYLNREERGGTLFFRQKVPDAEDAKGSGYLTESNEAFELLGRIEAAWNRLAIYPGFVPHSGEIAGDWIRGEERFTSPRLTQRFVFLP